MKDEIAQELLSAAKKVMAGLNTRIDEAPKTSVPVFDGMFELHDAINRAAPPEGKSQ